MRFSAKVAALGATTLVLVLVLATAGYGAIVTATAPINVNVNVDNYISMSSPANITLPTIAGTGGSAQGSATWSVTTNNSLGYKLEVSATGAPALTKGADSFADYGVTPTPWSVGAANSAFGFSNDGGLNYRGFNGTTPVQVHSLNTPVSGDSSTIIFKAEVGTTHLQSSGTYAANVTVTATTL